jgi:hypothetical protein
MRTQACTNTTVLRHLARNWIMMAWSLVPASPTRARLLALANLSVRFQGWQLPTT